MANYLGNSIVDYLASQGKASDFTSRTSLASQYGISNYTGTAEQNLSLLGKLRGAGGEKKPNPIITSHDAQDEVDNAIDGTNQISNQEAPKSDVEKYNAKLEAGLEEQSTAYSDFKNALNKITNGAIKYNPDELAQLKSIQNSMDAAHNEQLRMNRAGERLANVRRGRGEGDEAQLQYTMQQGIQKLKNLDVEAAGRLAETKNAIKEKRLKDIYDSYNALQDSLKQRQATIQQLQNNAMEIEKFQYQKNQDERDYQMKKEKNDLELQKLRNEIKTSGTATLGNSPLANNIKTAMAGIRFPSVADRKVATDAIASLLAEGDIQGAQSQLKQYAYNSANTTEQQVLSGKDDAMQSLKTIREKLAEFKAAGGNTGIFTGLKQKTLEKGGFYSGVASDIANDIALAIIDYRKAISGAAFTESEQKQYESVFPSIGKVPELNEAKINSLLGKFDRDINNFYSRRIPKYKELQETLDGFANQDEDTNSYLDSALGGDDAINNYLNSL